MLIGATMANSKQSFSLVLLVDNMPSGSRRWEALNCPSRATAPAFFGLCCSHGQQEERAERLASLTPTRDQAGGGLRLL
jgi:hypothetical protein